MSTSTSTGPTGPVRGLPLRLAWLPLLLLGSLLSCASHGGGAESISRVAHVQSDGANLWLLMRGDDRRAPVAIWLHGGPGGAETPLFRLYDRALEQRLVVVYWDQRGAGRSYDADADPALLTVDRHLIDLDRVVDFVRTELGVTQVSLIGHSWGSELGLLYVRRHPDKVAAFVGVNQVVSTLAQQRAQRSFVLSRARADGDEKTAKDIEQMKGPPFTPEQEATMDGLADRYGGVFHKRPSFLGATVSAIVRGYIRPWEIPSFIRANNVSLKAMEPELEQLDLRRRVPLVGVPVLFALGRHDRHVDARIAGDYFHSLRAPVKRLVWFENSAHNVPFEEPDRFVMVAGRFLLDPTGSLRR